MSRVMNYGKKMVNPVVRKSVLIWKAMILLTLTLCIALTVATFIAIDNSRNRTACLRTAQAVEECPVPSWWENLLRRVSGP
jgi:hypothetical protein